jgi:hypothetical protein
VRGGRTGRRRTTMWWRWRGGSRRGATSRTRGR